VGRETGEEVGVEAGEGKGLREGEGGEDGTARDEEGKRVSERVGCGLGRVEETNG